jgi:ATP-dependent RNA helicase DeaD
MICRRGGIDKHDIGAIRILDTTTEFEISNAAAESFAVKIRRPDKEDNIRIEPLTDAPQPQAPREQRLQPGFAKNKKYRNQPAYAGQPQLAGAAPAFGKKAKKNRRG